MASDLPTLKHELVCNPRAASFPVRAVAPAGQSVASYTTTGDTTERVAAVARTVAMARTTLSFATADFDVPIVSTGAELAVARHASIDLLATHKPRHDAAIVVMSFDAGVEPGAGLGAGIRRHDH